MTEFIRISRKAAMVAAIVMIAVLIAAPPASAQSLYGTIVGTVNDQSGAPVPGATVTATNTGTGHKVDAVTDGDGNYAFRNLQPGTYDLAIHMSGFRETKRTGIRASANNPVRQDLKLEVGTVSEAVTVIRVSSRTGTTPSCAEGVARTSGTTDTFRLRAPT